jgi:diaminopimelate epimerase
MTETTSTSLAGSPPAPREYQLMKYHGLGNDFLVLIDPHGLMPFGAELAVAVCDRHQGWGADGLLRAGPTDGHDEAFSFRLLNADGSEAEMSGNGLRCLVHAALDVGMVNADSPLRVQTPAGQRDVEVLTYDGVSLWATTGMGKPRVTGTAERCNVGHGQLLVDVGNPHLVVLGPDPASLAVHELGPLLETSEPSGLNVEFVTLGPGPDEVTMRVWERGVGETRACGTGSVAAAAAFRHWGRVGPKVTVHQPGGSVEVHLQSDGLARLSGPSRRVGSCSFFWSAAGAFAS